MISRPFRAILGWRAVNNTVNRGGRTDASHKRADGNPGTVDRAGAGLLPGLFLSLFLAVFLNFSANPASARTYTAIVIDADTGSVLYESRPDTRNRPASLTKMMTLYMVFEALREGKLQPTQMLTVSRRAAGQTPSKLFLKEGRKISVEQAILSVVTKSANDSATILAESLGGTEFAFAQKMTAKARELGMYRTQFRNATGLPNRRQVTTARDMAILARALRADFPEYFHYFATEQFQWGRRQFRNHNNLLGSYAGVNGIKTGYTRASGFNLTASAEREGKRIIAVVMGGRTAKSRDAQMRKLLDRAFAMPQPADMRYAMRSLQLPTPPQKPAQGFTAALRQLAGLPPLPHANAPKAAPQLVAAAVQPRGKPQTAPIVIPKAIAASALPLPSSKPPVNALSQLPRHQRWGVQVGTFKAADAAERQIKQATLVAPTYLKPAIGWVEPLEQPNRTLYRAKLAGMSKRIAHNTCRILVKKKFRCIALPPSQTIASLAR